MPGGHHARSNVTSAVAAPSLAVARTRSGRSDRPSTGWSRSADQYGPNGSTPDQSPATGASRAVSTPPCPSATKTASQAHAAAAASTCVRSRTSAPGRNPVRRSPSAVSTSASARPGVISAAIRPSYCWTAPGASAWRRTSRIRCTTVTVLSTAISHSAIS